MAKIDFLPDQKAPPVDQALEQMAERAILAERPIRLRVQPSFYDVDKQNYSPWRGLCWTLELEDVEEGRRLREGLEAFFVAFGKAEGAEAQERIAKVLERIDPEVSRG